MYVKTKYLILALTAVFCFGVALFVAFRIRKRNRDTSEDKDALFQEYFSKAIQYHISARSLIEGF
jgi:hypothetical protein